MIGCLVHDERLFSSDSAVRACHALRTYSYQHTDTIGLLRVHFFANASSNHYLTRDERYTICISGTLIFDNVHSAKALSRPGRSVTWRPGIGRTVQALPRAVHTVRD